MTAGNDPTPCCDDLVTTAAEDVDPSILEAFENDIKDFLLPDSKTSELELKLFDVNEEDEFRSELSSEVHHHYYSVHRSNYSHSNHTSIDTFTTDPTRFRGGSVSSNNEIEGSDSRYRSMRSSASSLVSNRSDKMQSLAAKLEQLSHAISLKDRSPKNRISTGNGDVMLQPNNIVNSYPNVNNHHRSTSHTSAENSSTNHSSPHSISPNQHRPVKALSRMSSDLEQRLRRSRQQFRQRSAATLRLSSMSMYNGSGHKETGIPTTYSELGSQINRSGGHDRAVADFANFIPGIAIGPPEMTTILRIPQNDLALPLWFLRQVLRSNHAPGAYITEHLFIPSDLWSITKINTSLLATRLKCLDDLTSMGSEFIQGNFVLGTLPSINLANLETMFNSSFIIPLNEGSETSKIDGSLTDRDQPLQSPTSAYTTDPLLPAEHTITSHERPKPRKSISVFSGSTLTPSVTAQSIKTTNSGFSALSGTMFRKFRKKSVHDTSVPSSGTISPTESITMLGPDAAAVRAPFLRSPPPPALTLYNYLSCISSLSACLESLEEIIQQSALIEDKEEHPVDLEEQRYKVAWISQFRTFAARVACRLILKDIAILQDVYKSDFKGFLLS